MRSDFAIFICTHGRPDKQLTLKDLLRSGYTGRWYLVLDDTDNTIQQYIDNYGVEHIIVFDKNHYINTCRDTGDVIGHYKCILYAKNAVEDIAQSLGVSAFMAVDDDVTFRYRYRKGEKIGSSKILDIDSALSAYIDFLLDSDATTVGFGTPISIVRHGYFNAEVMCYFRTPFVVLLRNAKHRVDWIGWYGEDNITTLSDSVVGGYWTSVPFIQYDTDMPGTTPSGGMSHVYRANDPFKLAFNIKRAFPSCIDLRPSKDLSKFLTVIQRKNAFPLLISDSYRR